MKTISTLLIATLTLSWIAICETKASDNNEQEIKCEALADPAKKKAIFVFPLDYSKTFSWFRETTPDSKLEYAWDVSIPTQNNQYTFGLYLFKFPNQEPVEGNIEMLLSSCQQTASTVEYKNNTSTHKVDFSLKIKAMTEDFGLGVFINDPGTYDKILGEKPLTASFTTINPDGTNRCNATIQYKQ